MMDCRVKMEIPKEGIWIGDEYKFIKEIGRGGYSITYLVEGPGAVIYIVKELYPVNYGEFYERDKNGLLIEVAPGDISRKQNLNKAIEREIAMSDKINRDVGENVGVGNTNSPYIFRSEKMDFGQLRTDVPYIKIATTSGNTLKDELEKDLSKEDIVNIIKKVYKAVKYGLHNKNIVHGDLKLENIYITGDSIKLIDFGSSYVMGSYSKECLLLDNGLSYSKNYASTRLKRLASHLLDIYRCKAKEISEEEINNKLEQAYDEANMLSAYEDMYALFVMLFYMMFGCYPFKNSLETLADVHGFLRFQDINIMVKRLFWVMAEAFDKENVDYVERHFEEWIEDLISAITPGRDLYELAISVSAYKDEFYGIKKRFDKRYAKGQKGIVTGASDVDYSISYHPDIKHYDDLIEEFKSIKDGKKTYIITGNAEMGKTWFCKSFVCELYDDFITNGRLPFYYERLTKSVYDRINKKIFVSNWYKSFVVIEDTDLALEDIDKLYNNGLILVEKSEENDIDKEYCVKKDIAICLYSFNEDALRVDNNRYNEVLDNKVNLSDEFYQSPYIAELIKAEFKATGKITTSKRALIENNIEFKLSKYNDFKKLLDKQALSYARMRMVKDHIVEEDVEMCNKLVSSNLMAFDNNYNDNKIIRFIDGYYEPYYLARIIMKAYKENSSPISLKCSNKDMEMLACFIDEDKSVNAEEACKFISGGDATTEYAFNLVNLYRYSKTIDTITIKNVDFRGIWDLQHYLYNVNKDIIFENCSFSNECFSISESVVFDDVEDLQRPGIQNRNRYSCINHEFDNEGLQRYSNIRNVPVLCDNHICKVSLESISKKYIAKQLIAVGYEGKDGLDNLSEPLIKSMRVCVGSSNYNPEASFIDYHIRNDEMFLLTELNGKNYYLRYPAIPKEGYTYKGVPTDSTGLKPISIRVNDDIIAVGYGTEEDYNRCKAHGYPGRYNKYCRIKKLYYGRLNEDGRVGKWLGFKELLDAKNIVLIKQNLNNYIGICNDKNIKFYECKGDELVLAARKTVQEYDYCISNEENFIVLGTSNKKLYCLDCSEIKKVELSDYKFKTCYNPYSMGWINKANKEWYASTVCNLDDIQWIFKYEEDGPKVLRSKWEVEQRPNWTKYTYKNCDFYESMELDKKDHGFTKLLISECLKTEKLAYSDKMKYAMRSLVEDKQLELNSDGIIEVSTYVYFILGDKALYEKIISTYYNIIDDSMKDLIDQDAYMDLIPMLMGKYICDLSTEAIVNYKYNWIKKLMLPEFQGTEKYADVLYKMSSLFYDFYQAVAPKSYIPDEYKIKHFELALDVCMMSKELGNKNAIRTWNEYMLYGHGKTMTLVFY